MCVCEKYAGTVGILYVYSVQCATLPKSIPQSNAKDNVLTLIQIRESVHCTERERGRESTHGWRLQKRMKRLIQPGHTPPYRHTIIHACYNFFSLHFLLYYIIFCSCECVRVSVSVNLYRNVLPKNAF